MSEGEGMSEGERVWVRGSEDERVRMRCEGEV